MDYDNFVPLIEVVAVMLLPSGKTRQLRTLIDCGATDNFIHEQLTKEFKLEVSALGGSNEVAMGTEGAT